ncbi:MAG: methionyl-tRNA formyltransferase, partial [Planctomycetes bacterium]|nr:methionyl-tRNA formyltransferase [Planctomycetota bacterium]
RGMDTGDMLLKVTTPIDPDETAQDLHDRLSEIGGKLIVETINQVNAGAIEPEAQDDALATNVSMLKKADGLIDWTRSDKAICAHINAMTPWPGAFTHLDGKRLKIFKAVPGKLECGSHGPGEIIECDGNGIHVATGESSVIILELMGSSGKRLAADAFLRGHSIDLPAR